MEMNTRMNRRGFALLLGAGALAARTAAAQDTGSDTEIGEQLPAADLPSMNSQGHLFELSSTWEGSFDSVPTDAPVYKMELATYSQEQAQALTEAIGVEGDLQDLGSGSFSAQDRDGQLYVGQGRVQYISSAKVEDGDLQDDATAITTAREWLRQAGMLPADVGEGEVLERSDTPKRIVAGFQPLVPSPLISATPMVSATMAANGQVVEASNAWAKITQDVTYQLRGADFAWQEVEDRRAWIDASLPTDTWAPGSTIGGSVVYKQIALAYTTSGIPGERQYLQPVYVFHGEMKPDGDDRTFAAKAYVAALINSNQPVG